MGLDPVSKLLDLLQWDPYLIPASILSLRGVLRMTQTFAPPVTDCFSREATGLRPLAMWLSDLVYLHVPWRSSCLTVSLLSKHCL